MKHFTKSFNIGHTKECWNYLKGHYTYDVMNSWNGLRTIANNVKVYNLPLKYDCYEVFGALEEDNWVHVNETIMYWEDAHPNYEVYFNGRSGGYLILKNKKNNCNILPSEILDYDDYEDFKKYCTVGFHESDIRFYAELVRDFDRLCDELIDVCNECYEQYQEYLKEKAEEEARPKLTTERKLEMFDSLLGWISEHDEEFVECALDAMGVTDEEAVLLELKEAE